MLEEFKTFAIRGNVIDMNMGVIGVGTGRGLKIRVYVRRSNVAA